MNVNICQRSRRPSGLLLAVLLSLLAACAAPPTPTPPPTPVAVTVLASDLTEPLLHDLAVAYAEVNRAVVVVPLLTPAAELAERLQAGEADLALLASTPAPDAGLFATPVGHVRLQVVVHPSNALDTLMVDQAQALFGGQAVEWSQVGGSGGQVQVVVRPGGTDAAELFAAGALAGAAVTPNALVAPSWEAMRQIVGEDPNAIGYLPRGEVTGAVRPVSLPVEVRALLLAAAPEEPAGPARDFLAWVQSEAGQAVVAQRYEALK